MNGGRADASTSTEDVKGRPLCLFYFTHPFGVLSPEPPTITTAPPNIARTFVNMEPVPPFWTSSSSQDYDTTSTRPSFDLGNATVHRNPISLVRNYEVDFQRDTFSSSFFSSDLWFSSSASSKNCERRVIPYHKTLPPLELPTRDLPIDLDSSDDVWPKKCLNREKFSLPPIELPLSSVSDVLEDKVSICDSDSVKKCKRVVGVQKHKRKSRLSSVRRMLTHLMRRKVRGGRARNASPALREALRVLRDAWPEPRLFTDRWKAVSEDSCRSCEKNVRNMWGNEVPARASASPGLLRRRYSVPETIMRKYRLAQQRSEGEGDETGRWSASGAAAGTRNSCAWCGTRTGARREREHMRKSALLRLWGRAGASPARTCPCVPCPPCGTRSLDASHSELHSSPRRLRLDSRDRHSDGSSGSPARAVSSCTDPIPDIAREASPRRINETRIVRTPVASPVLHADTTDRSLTSSSDIFTTSMPTMKENVYKPTEPYTRISTSEYIDGRVSERSGSAENDESNVVPYTQPLTLETPSYDVLEIIVSETVDVGPIPALKNGSPQKIVSSDKQYQFKNHVSNSKKSNMELDEYVSNILVESLNSLTDQLESMNASIGSDRKLSIVEKEIKVKLQNTGVNTIVHLSPTSNNQIIFGNEELYESDGRRDNCNNPNDSGSINIREDALSFETNNNLTSADSVRNNDSARSHDKSKSENFLSISNETVNKAVLQQIQKLFQEELQNVEPEMNSPDGPLPGISHIEISNVDVYIDNNGGSYTNSDTIEMQTKRNSGIEVLGGVGTGNYYQEVDDSVIVPRFSAFPHTESMEVNTSSSEDAELLGSECTSLVDSLDDPNSPRSILLRRSYSNNKRSELVRSAIDVLDLLPEDANQNRTNSPKEKGESFFIRIKDNDCDCEKENIVVADHMPETIKQKLYRRHRKREMRMECARRSKVKQLKRDLESQNRKDIYKTKREIEKECMVIINSVIDDVIAKIAQDEYKCMRISQKANKLVATKSEENLLKKQWKKDSENNNNRSSRKLIKNNISHSCSDNLDKDNRKPERLIRGKLSLQTHPPLSPEDSGPKRIYQKSEIHDGNKCIEILEILEYVNSSQNSDTTTSDENHNLSSRIRKSRIPIPVSEKVQRTSKVSSQRNHKSNSSRRAPPILSRDRNGKSHLLANMLFDALSEENSTHDKPSRRASVPCDSRARSNSLRFQNVFDIIPEERSSLSLESTGDDSAYNRRASAPSLTEFHSTDQEEKRPGESNKHRATRCADMKNTGTSPMPDIYRAQLVNVGAMTSPIRKSAGTSPIRITSGESRIHSEQHKHHQQPKLAKRVQKHEEGSSRQKSVSSQYEPTRRLRGGHSDHDAIPSIFRLKRGKKNDKQSLESNSVSERRSSEEASVEERAKNRSRNVLSMPRKEKNGEERKQKGLEGREGEGEEWSSSESSGSLLCSLAPAWLTARRRRRRAAPSGEWAVTVAGSCPAALPNDVEMRLRFPDPRRRNSTSSEQTPRPPPPLPSACHRAVDCGAQCAQGGRTRRVIDDASRLTLTVKKEASVPDVSNALQQSWSRESLSRDHDCCKIRKDSSIIASKSVKKSSDLLPDLQTYRASRSKTRSSVKTRRGYSLHCWLPEDEPTPIRARNGLAVEGNAIVPRRKPRAPSMSERDLTRGLPSRHYLPLNLRTIF